MMDIDFFQLLLSKKEENIIKTFRNTDEFVLFFRGGDTQFQKQAEAFYLFCLWVSIFPEEGLKFCNINSSKFFTLPSAVITF